MDKKYVIIANWKMNLTLADSVKLLKQYKKLRIPRELEIVVAPTYPTLPALSKLLKYSRIKLGAQNSAAVEAGAFTGEVSPVVLREIGCEYVILGHSERKRYFGESFELISNKVAAALKNGLIPIICIGETWEEKDKGLLEVVIEKQLREALSKVGELGDKKIIISYEPFWTISTSNGRIATSAEALHGCRVIRGCLLDLFGHQATEENFSLIYGGTVSAETIHNFLGIDLIEGFLVGAASLDATKFKQLLESF